MISLPKSDRGYAKNEIVAAVVELYVPKNETVSGDFNLLKFGGENVSLNVTDNDFTGTAAELATSGFTTATDSTFVLADKELVRTLAGAVSPATNNPIPVSTSNKTYKWLFFAKVTDDDASLYVKLVDGAGNTKFVSNVLDVTLKGDDYKVTKAFTAGTGGTYTISWSEGTPAVAKAIVLYVDKNYKTTGMAIDTDTSSAATKWALGVDVNKVLGVVDPTDPAKFLSASNADAKDVMEIYDDIAVDVFGLDYMLIGNYMRDSFFENLVSADTIVATVDIEPWTAYVTVPDEVIVTPPKTGDAASILGFVMVALSGAGAVALRKRG